ncbi:ferrochelatase, partial [Pseudomonas sp. 2822-17]|uniref:ferrochelatase n=1 Tax=Pseudomonas sp. 2822-17 TaxID=1712678 RepID=UPI0015A967B7
GRAKEEAESIDGPKIQSVDSWYDEPKFIAYWAHQIKQTREKLNTTERENHVVVFLAHSLPERILQVGDPYPEQLEKTAALIAAKADVK